MTKICLECNKIIKKHGNKFCSLSCSCKYNGRIAKEKSIQKYYTSPNICLQCGKTIQIQENKGIIEAKQKKFCNHSCSTTYNNRKREKKILLCRNCKKVLPNQYAKYCNMSCQKEFRYNKFISDWKSGKTSGHCGDSNYTIASFLRIYLFKKYNNKCCKCGWNKVHLKTGRIPLQINHIDGDCSNNKEENLELLCPNCHSLTETYGSLNMNNSKRK